MQLHQLKPKNKLKKKKRVGRGGKRGTYCGRGQKGQNARSGATGEPMIRGLLKRYPKLRGYNQRSRFKEIAIVKLKKIDEFFDSNEVISPQTLFQKKLIKKKKGKMPIVKILGGNYEFSKKISIDSCFLSEKAKEMILKTGGNVDKSL